MNIGIIICGIALISTSIWLYCWVIKAAGKIREHGGEIDRLKTEYRNLDARTSHMLARLSEIVGTLDKRYSAREVKKVQKSLEELAKTDRFEDIIYNEDDEH